MFHQRTELVNALIDVKFWLCDPCVKLIIFLLQVSNASK